LLDVPDYQKAQSDEFAISKKMIEFERLYRCTILKVQDKISVQYVSEYKLYCHTPARTLDGNGKKIANHMQKMFYSNFDFDCDESRINL